MITNVEALAEFLEQSVRDFTDIAVVGVSGGVDSSVVASICVKALGKENVVLVSMPYDDIDRSSFNSRSAKLAEKLGAIHYTIAIEESCVPLEKELKNIYGELDKLTYANIRPRVRMNILYSISGQLGYSSNKRARVMGTGHLSEDIIGYDTKGGDALCDIFILSDLLKSEVYQLANHYEVIQEIIDAKPSAGLYPEQTDEQELGYTYDKLEPATLALYHLLKDGISLNQISEDNEIFKDLNKEYVNFVINRYKIHFHKHEAPVTLDCRKSEWFE